MNGPRPLLEICQTLMGSWISVPFGPLLLPPNNCSGSWSCRDSNFIDHGFSFKQIFASLLAHVLYLSVSVMRLSQARNTASKWTVKYTCTLWATLIYYRLLRYFYSLFIILVFLVVGLFRVFFLVKLFRYLGEKKNLYPFAFFCNTNYYYYYY